MTHHLYLISGFRRRRHDVGASLATSSASTAHALARLASAPLKQAARTLDFAMWSAGLESARVREYARVCVNV